jgi:valyl-tRNA synthetase
MIMDGLDCMHEVPFKDVYIHATVLTEDGRRMSKSLGTGVDPGEVIDKYGADALRHTILSQAGYNQDIRFSDRRVEDSRNFCNKIWNAVRFTLMNVEHMPNKPSSMHATDIWLLSRLHDTEKTVRGAFNAYDAQLASQALHRFFWSELCDWYIEVSKKRLLEPGLRSAPQWVLLTCLEAFVKMLHPIMPHVTEEVYSVLPNPDKAPYLMASSWPIVPDEYSDPRVEAEVERAFSMTRSLRALRAELGLTPGKQTPAAFYEGSLDGAADIVRRGSQRTFGRASCVSRTHSSSSVQSPK